MDTATKLIGQRFGKLVVVGPSDPGKGEYLFVCDCGQSVKRNIYTARRNLKNGYTVSCGCSRSYAKMLGDNNPQRRKGQHKPMAKCEYCQKEFKVMGNRIGRKYCSVLCSNYVRARAKLDLFAKSFLPRIRQRIANARAKQPANICKWCGIKTHSPAYCSRECTQKGTGHKSHKRNCIVCRIEFLGVKHQLYCSPKCSDRSVAKRHWTLLNYQSRSNRRNLLNKYQRARTAVTGKNKRISIFDVYKAKGTDCGICGKPIDLDAKCPAHNAGTIDHIVPISKDGLHVMENLRPAHFICNSKRGNQTQPGVALSEPEPEFKDGFLFSLI